MKTLRVNAVLAGLTAAVVTLAACAAPQTAPTPAKPAEAAKPAAAAPTAAVKASAAAKSAAAASPAAVGMAPGVVGSPISVSGPLEGEAKELSGAGATFPAPLYTKWFEEYNRLTGVKVNYQAIGSGGGIRAITEQTVNFAGSDAPLTDAQLQAAKGGELFHIPTALGAVVVTYNLPNMQEQLKLEPSDVVGIYLGEIKKWNAPELVEHNPQLQNVNQDIVVVHRSDASGTTSIFTDYLSSVSAPWKQNVGVGTTVKWPTGLGGKGNAGVAGEVKQTPYSIGYVELIYALENKLGVAQIQNKAGNFVEPNINNVTAAAAGVAQTIQPDLRASIVNADGESAYPISGFTWLLAYKNMDDRAKALALTRMLWWATHDAQRFNSDLGYAPVPEAIVQKSEAFIRQISVDGQPVFPIAFPNAG